MAPPKWEVSSSYETALATSWMPLRVLFRLDTDPRGGIPADAVVPSSTASVEAEADVVFGMW